MTAVVCFLSTAQQARSELILPGFSGPVANRPSVSDEFSDLSLSPYVADAHTDYGAGSSRSMDSEQVDLPETKPESDPFLFMTDPTHVGSSGTGGMSGSQSHLDLPSSLAIASLWADGTPVITLSGWLQANHFLFVPGAPRSGLLRPPRSTAATFVVQS